MRITIEADKLAEVIGAVKGTVDRGGNIPILATCLLSARSGMLSLAGTNLDMWGYADVPCEGEGSLCIPLWLLESACIKGRDVTIQSDGKRAQVSAGKSRFEGGVLPASDFPSTAPTFTTSGSLSGRELARALAFAMPSAEADGPARYYMAGVYFQAAKGIADITATDGHRLSSIRIPCAFDVSGALIPNRACTEIVSLAAAHETVDVQFGETAISLTAGNRRIVSKLIDGSFPDWRRVLPKKASDFVRIDVAEAVAALTRILKASSASAASEKTKVTDHAVALSIGDGLTITRPFVAVETLQAEIVGDTKPVGFNAAYLRDALRSLQELGAETATIDLSDPGAPQRIEGPDNVTAVVMPMHLPAGFVPDQIKEAA